MLDESELRAGSESLQWFHSIDLGHGVVTKGLSEGPYISESALPDVRGKAVLDVGAWDGYYSFLAERLGATPVVALDHYAWGVDMVAREQYWNECRSKGILPDHSKDATEFWRPELPGRRGFDFARRALQSTVQPLVADFMTVDLSRIGIFDVVLYFGVLYHMKEPLRALERVRNVTREVAVIETYAIDVPGLRSEGVLVFHPGDEVNADFGNWFAPSADALRRLCTAAGFGRVEIVAGPPSVPPPVTSARERARRSLSVLRGREHRGEDRRPDLVGYRLVARAYV
jgi:tRNA (mo5U34)-methyltransferase